MLELTLRSAHLVVSWGRSTFLCLSPTCHCSIALPTNISIAKMQVLSGTQQGRAPLAREASAQAQQAAKMPPVVLRSAFSSRSASGSAQRRRPTPFTSVVWACLAMRKSYEEKL